MRFEYGADRPDDEVHGPAQRRPQLRLRHARPPDPGRRGRRLARRRSSAGAHGRRHDGRRTTRAQSRTTTYKVERTADGAIKRTVTNETGQSTVTVVGNDGVTTVTRPTAPSRRPRKGPTRASACRPPVHDADDGHVPSGKRTTVEDARTVELNRADDPLDLRYLTETVDGQREDEHDRYERPPAASPRARRRGARSSPTSTASAGRRRSRSRASRPRSTRYNNRGRLTRDRPGRAGDQLHLRQPWPRRHGHRSAPARDRVQLRPRRPHDRAQAAQRPPA